MSKKSTKELLLRVAKALERMAPAPAQETDFSAAEAFIWHGKPPRLSLVAKISRVDLGLLKGIDQTRDILIENTRRFAHGLPANNALLWGARGMGKSSLVKAAHHHLNTGTLRLIEIHREDIETLPDLLGILRRAAEFPFHRLLR